MNCKQLSEIQSLWLYRNLCIKNFSQRAKRKLNLFYLYLAPLLGMLFLIFTYPKIALLILMVYFTDLFLGLRDNGVLHYFFNLRDEAARNVAGNVLDREIAQNGLPSALMQLRYIILFEWCKRNKIKLNSNTFKLLDRSATEKDKDARFQIFIDSLCTLLVLVFFYAIGIDGEGIIEIVVEHWKQQITFSDKLTHIGFCSLLVLAALCGLYLIKEGQQELATVFKRRNEALKGRINELAAFHKTKKAKRLRKKMARGDLRI